MKSLRRVGIFMAGLLTMAFIGIGVFYTPKGAVSLYPQAAAVIGRPLTPFSVAGVARRTVRRCAYGVYYC